MTIREQAPDSSLRAALTDASLPTADLDFPGRKFFRLEDGEKIVAYGGLEIHGSEGLLRSVVVLRPYRALGFGRAITLALIAEARRRGLARLWLLTLTSADLFEKFGFERSDRTSAPAAIADSAEFASLCPASAVCMTLGL